MYKKITSLNALLMVNFLLFGFFASTLSAQDIRSSPIGKWRTIDDETGKPKSVVELYLNNGEIEGRVLELFNPSKPNPVCDKCIGERKDKPITGMNIVWGVTPNKAGDRWGGGHILDPKKGKTYKVKFSLKDEGKQLKVRGYIGMPMLGRTQVWERVVD